MNATAATTAAIEIEGLTKEFGSTRALDNVSFAVPQKSVFGLLGPNGAGKTTLFSLVASFLRPTAGRVRVLGIDVREISQLRGRLSILPQDAQFQANVPVIEQVIFFARLSGRSQQEAEKDAREALTLVGLEDAAKKGARVLSHGMTKRLGIAQAFLGNPEVILLDEPTAGLDPKAARDIRDLIDRLRSSATVVVSSHDLEEIQKMCSAVAILDHGKLVECAQVADITRAGTQLRITFARALTAAQLATLKAIPGIAEVQASGETSFGVTLAADGDKDAIIAQAVGALAATGAVPRSIEDGVALESRFLELTEKK